MTTGTPRHSWVDNSTAITAAKLNETEQDVADALATANANTTALTGKASTVHTHGVTDLTATGTRDATTYLRGDNTWAAVSAGTSYTDEQVRDVVGATLTAGSNVTITPNDAANTITIAASGSGGTSTTSNVVSTYGADPTGVADSTAAFQANITAGDVFIPAGTYKVGNVTYEGASSRRIIALGPAKIIATDVYGVFDLRGGWDAMGTVSSYSTQSNTMVSPGEPTPTYSVTRSTTLTLATSKTFNQADIVKIVADNQVPTGRNANARVGEYAVVPQATTGTSVALNSILIESYTTNIRLARLWDVSFTISGPLIFDCDTTARNTGGYGAVVLMRAAQKCYIGGGVEFHNSPGRAIGNYTYGSQIDGVRFRNIDNRPLLNHYGYGVQDGGWALRMSNCYGETLRHMYSEGSFTSGANDSDYEYYGGGWHAIVSDCVGMGCQAQPFDTHGTAYGTVFSSCYAIGSFVGSSSGGAGFATRGRNITLYNCVADGCYRGYEIGSDNTALYDCIARKINLTALEISGDTDDGTAVTNLKRILISGGDYESGEGGNNNTILGTAGYTLGIEIRGARFTQTNAASTFPRMMTLLEGVTLKLSDVIFDWESYAGPSSSNLVGTYLQDGGNSITGKGLLMRGGSTAFASITGFAPINSTAYASPIQLADIEWRHTSQSLTLFNSSLTAARYSAKFYTGSTAATRTSTTDLALTAAASAVLPISNKLDAHITVLLSGTAGAVTLGAIPTAGLVAGQRVTVINASNGAVTVPSLNTIAVNGISSYVFSQGAWRTDGFASGGGGGGGGGGGTTPAFGSVTTAAPNTSASSVTINVPTSTADGDQLLLFVSHDFSAAWTTPTGWTLLDSVVNTDTQGVVFSRVASSEPSSYTVTAGGAGIITATMVRYTGVTAVRDAEHTITTLSTTSATSPTPAALTGVQSTDRVAVFYAMVEQSTSNAAGTLTGPGGAWTTRGTVSSATTATTYQNAVLVADATGADTLTAATSSKSIGAWAVISVGLY